MLYQHRQIITTMIQCQFLLLWIFTVYSSYFFLMKCSLHWERCLTCSGGVTTYFFLCWGCVLLYICKNRSDKKNTHKIQRKSNKLSCLFESQIEYLNRIQRRFFNLKCEIFLSIMMMIRWCIRCTVIGVALLLLLTCFVCLFITSTFTVPPIRICNVQAHCVRFCENIHIAMV